VNLKPTTAIIVGALVAFVAVLAAYVVLAATGHGTEAAGVAGIVTTLLGLVGLGAHQSSRLSEQDAQLSTISHQTNGVLDKRIQDGADTAMRQVLREAGYNVPAPAETPAQPEAIPDDGTTGGTGL
jgi:hypothetical protein